MVSARAAGAGCGRVESFWGWVHVRPRVHPSTPAPQVMDWGGGDLMVLDAVPALTEGQHECDRGHISRRRRERANAEQNPLFCANLDVANVQRRWCLSCPPQPRCFGALDSTMKGSQGKGQLRGNISSSRKVAKCAPGESWGLWQSSVCVRQFKLWDLQGGEISPLRKFPLRSNPRTKSPQPPVGWNPTVCWLHRPLYRAMSGLQPVPHLRAAPSPGVAFPVIPQLCGLSLFGCPVPTPGPPHFESTDLKNEGGRLQWAGGLVPRVVQYGLVGLAQKTAS